MNYSTETESGHNKKEEEAKTDMLHYQEGSQDLDLLTYNCNLLFAH